MLPTDPFAGCWHRIDRARTHREAAAREWNAYLDEDPYEFGVHVDDDGHGTIWIEELVPVPPILGILFGE